MLALVPIYNKSIAYVHVLSRLVAVKLALMLLSVLALVLVYNKTMPYAHVLSRLVATKTPILV